MATDVTHPLYKQMRAALNRNRDAINTRLGPGTWDVADAIDVVWPLIEMGLDDTIERGSASASQLVCSAHGWTYMISRPERQCAYREFMNDVMVCDAGLVTVDEYLDATAPGRWEGGNFIPSERTITENVMPRVVSDEIDRLTADLEDARVVIKGRVKELAVALAVGVTVGMKVAQRRRRG